MIADQWLLSDSIKEALTEHHGQENTGGENRQIVMMTRLANMYANISGFAVAGDSIRDEAKLAWVLESLGFAREDLQTLEDPVRSAIEKEEIFLHISGERI